MAESWRGELCGFGWGSPELQRKHHPLLIQYRHLSLILWESTLCALVTGMGRNHSKWFSISVSVLFLDTPCYHSLSFVSSKCCSSVLRRRTSSENGCLILKGKKTKKGDEHTGFLHAAFQTSATPFTPPPGSLIYKVNNGVKILEELIWLKPKFRTAHSAAWVNWCFLLERLPLPMAENANEHRASHLETAYFKYYFCWKPLLTANTDTWAEGMSLSDSSVAPKTPSVLS